MQYARKLPEFAEITQSNAITPFKVTDFGTNRKLIYDFLLVININLPPTLHRFRNRNTWLPLVFNCPVGGVPLGRSP